jgi:hypothetical protein
VSLRQTFWSLEELPLCLSVESSEPQIASPAIATICEPACLPLTDPHLVVRKKSSESHRKHNHPLLLTGDKDCCSGPGHRKSIARKWTKFLPHSQQVHAKYIQGFPFMCASGLLTQSFPRTFTMSLDLPHTHRVNASQVSTRCAHSGHHDRTSRMFLS